MSNSSWDYKDKHIDSTIDNPNSFVSSSKCVLFAANYDKLTSKYNVFNRIGVIQGFNWGEQRQIEMVFELGSDIPYLIPGRTTGQISLSRILLFGKDLANVLLNTTGETAIKSIKDINAPFSLIFALYSNEEKADKTHDIKYSRLFSNCWIQARNESIGAGQMIIAENVNIMYENIINYTFTG